MRHLTVVTVKGEVMDADVGPVIDLHGRRPLGKRTGVMDGVR
jgi:hypothetical protein